MPILALASVAAFLAWPLANPHLTPASAFFLATEEADTGNNFVVTGSGGQIIRDGEWTVTNQPAFSVPATGTSDPGTAQALARDLLLGHGIDRKSVV